MSARASGLLVALGVAALAGWLRLRLPGDFEFQYDEALALLITERIRDGELVQVGLSSSVGALNPPLFPYLVALPAAMGGGLLAATSFVGALGAAAAGLTVLVMRPRFGLLAAGTTGVLLAVSPWMVRYGRKLWAQDLLPIVLVLLLWVLFLVLERKRTWAAAAIPVLLCAAFQLHFSALALALPSAAVLAFRGRSVRWSAVAVGTGLALLLLAPYAVHEVGNGFVDLRRLSQEGGDGVTAWNWAGVSRAVDRTSQLVSAEDWRSMLGPAEPAFALEHRVARLAGRLAGLIAIALLLFGLVRLSVLTVRRARPVRTWPFVELEVRETRLALLVVWVVAVWLSFVSSSPDRVYLHYLIVTVPPSFAIVGVTVSHLRSSLSALAKRDVTLLATAIVLLMAIGLGSFTLAHQSFVSARGGAPGGQGVSYRHVAALARAATAEGRPIDDLALEAARQALGGDAAASAQAVTVVDTLRGSALEPCEGDVRRFGPLEACFP